MSKIICISNKVTYTFYDEMVDTWVRKEIILDLTIGKIYDVLDIFYKRPREHKMYTIEDDSGVICSYGSHYFKDIDFIRDKLLTDLGIL